MNLLLLTETDLLSPQRAQISDTRRLEHIVRVLKAREGDTLTVGLLNGAWGEGLISTLNESAVVLELELNRPAPAPLPLTLLLALPRPQQIKRILQTVAATGIKELHLMQTRRVEKSYWQSPSVTGEEIHRQLILGLEQGRDTLMPRVHLHKRFRPFVEDELPGLLDERLALVAHPYTSAPCPHQVAQPTVLAVGPEGGFNDFEIERFAEAGFQGVHLGERILKTEVAIPFLIGRLF